MVSQSSPQLKRRPGPLAPLGQLGQGLGQGLAYSRKGRTLGKKWENGGENSPQDGENLRDVCWFINHEKTPSNIQ